MEKELILSRARSAAIARDFPLAIKLYKSLLKENPSDLEILNQLGAAYVKFGDDEKALLYYEQILAFSPHDINAMNSMGAIYRRLKRYDDSIRILQRGLDEDVNTQAVNYNLGFTYKEMGDFDAAIEAFTSVIEENPDDVLAHNHLGSIYYQKKNFAKAMECFRTGLQVDPNHPILLYNLAKCYEEENQYADAIQCYENALKARPGWTEALRDFSELLIKCQKTEEARAVVKRTIDLNPEDAKLYMLLGEIFLNECDYDSAITTFRQADSIENNNIRILTGLADAFEKGEHPDDALEVMNRAMDLEPLDKDVEKQFVHVCLSAEEYNEAYTHVESLFKADGENDAQILDLFGQYYICVGDDANAKKYFEQIPSVAPEYKLYLLEAANRYSQIGKIREAEELAKKYITDVPSDAQAYSSLGKIYEKQGKTVSAAKSFKKSGELSKNNVYAKNKMQVYKDLELDDSPIFEPVNSDELSSWDFKPSISVAKKSSDTSRNNNLHFDDAKIEKPQLDGFPDDGLSDEKNAFSVKEEISKSLETMKNAIGSDEEGLGAIEELEEIEELSGANAFDEKNQVSAQKNTDSSGFYDACSKINENPVEPPKQFDEKTNELIAQAEDASERDDELQEICEMKENIEDAFEEKVSEVLDDGDPEERLECEGDSTDSEKKEFDFDESDCIIDDGADSGDPEMTDDEMLSDGFGTVDNFFDDTDATFADVDNIISEPESKDDVHEEIPEQNEPEELEELLDEVTDDEIQANLINEDAPFEDIITAAAEVANDAEIAEQIDLSKPKDSFDFLDPLAAVRSMLPNIERILQDTDYAHAHATELELFIKMKQFCEFLPTSELDEYRHSKMRMLLDYLIAKFSGKPGLLLTAESLMKAGVLGEGVLEEVYEKEVDLPFDREVEIVLEYMKKLTSGLTSRRTAEVLCAEADRVLEKMANQCK